MTDNIRNDDFLDNFFVAARTEHPVPDAALYARILADAEGVQAGFNAVCDTTSDTTPQGIFVRLSQALGGGLALAGLTTAAVAGLWIGLAAPQSIHDLTAGYIGMEAAPPFADLMPSLDLFLVEG